MGWLSKRKQGDPDDEPLDIPLGTAVDPALFPEDEFPVECLGCGYELRGLPDGRCPECGREFARGELLVSVYYFGESRRKRWIAILGAVCFWVALLVLGLYVLSLLIALVFLVFDPTPTLESVGRGGFRVWSVVAVLTLAACSLGFSAAIMASAHFGPNYAKRDAVRSHLTAVFRKRLSKHDAAHPNQNRE